MIDTIKIILKNVSRYPLTKASFEATSNDGQTVVQINEDTGEYIESSHIRALLHHDTDNIIPLTKRSSVHIGSSHYSLLYKYNLVNDKIEFEFSIPKYMWGTNILQFVRYYDHSAAACYKYLMGFVKAFIAKMCLDVIDMRDVSIGRIDFCYNQFFASRYDAMKYLNEQKELLPKFARSTKNDYRSYDSSLAYITKRYSFKIYHKGTEFKKHDMVKLADKNPTGEHIDKLLEVSDRILRYEVTIRKAQIDYMFRTREMYTKLLPGNDVIKFWRHADRRYYNAMVKFCEQGHDYVCAPVDLERMLFTKEVYFSFDVFNMLFEFFWEYVKKYQLHCRLSVMDVVKRVNEANDVRDTISDVKLRAKMSFNKPMLTALALLCQGMYSLDDIKKLEILPRRSFFRYQSQLKRLGFVSEGRLIDVAPPSLDYVDYLYDFGHHHSK